MSQLDTTISARMIIKGDFDPATFAAWITHRANLLSLGGWVRPESEQLIVVVVTGDKILVDAFEVACSLGPVSAHVKSIDISAENTPSDRGHFYLQNPHPAG